MYRERLADEETVPVVAVALFFRVFGFKNFRTSVETTRATELFAPRVFESLERTRISSSYSDFVSVNFTS